jgi:uncharacterized protein YkwD
MSHSMASHFGFLSRVVSSVLSVITLLVVVFICSVSAQTLEPRPVARLVSSTHDIAGPRRAASEVKTPVANESALPTFAEANSIERSAFEQTNAVRLQSGLQPFIWDAALCRLARAHSENMALLGFFSHATPEGHRLKDRARLAGIRYQVIAENIAHNMGYDDPGAFAVERWMISPGHRANIMYAGFTSMAVGTFVAADGSVFLTQTFITR